MSDIYPPVLAPPGGQREQAAKREGKREDIFFKAQRFSCVVCSGGTCGNHQWGKGEIFPMACWLLRSCNQPATAAAAIRKQNFRLQRLLVAISLVVHKKGRPMHSELQYWLLAPVEDNSLKRSKVRIFFLQNRSITNFQSNPIIVQEGFGYF